MEATLVIKVKYGQILRRLNAYLLPGMEKFDLDIDGLRDKICSLFNFPHVVDLTMTYVDEDGDEVSLVDDDDLLEALRQRLNCLRVDVRLSNETSSETNVQSSGNSTPLRSPRTENCVPNINADLAEILKSLPEPVREEFSKLYNDIFAKSLVHMVDSYRNSDSQPRTGAESSTQNAPLESPMPCIDLNVHPTCCKESECTMLNLEPSAYNTSSGMKEETGKEEEKETTPCFPNGIHGSDAELEHLNLCPYSGVPVAGYFPFRPISYSHIYPSQTSFSQCAGLNPELRRRCSCDGCGAYSITGPCFMSRMEDFDPSSMCFEQIKNPADFVRMDDPIRGLDHQHPLSIFKACRAKAVRPQLDSRFIMDVNFLDGTFMAPGTPFTKIWRMRNSGSVDWPEGTQLLWNGGHNFNCPRSVKIEALGRSIRVGEEVDIAVDFFAPECPGWYMSFWRMATPSGQRFGQCVWTVIQVEASLGRTPSASLQDLNLNLPPKCDMCFPIDETLVVGQSFPSPTILTAPVSSSAVPIVLGDQKFSVPSWPSPTIPTAPVSNAHIPPYDIVQLERNLVEDLKRLQLKRADLINREALRMQEHNLEQSVDDDLCGMSEWDPILEELEEMGFCDQMMNKKLLLKNNGSMTHVVMDLISGEKVATE